MRQGMRWLVALIAIGMLAGVAGEAGASGGSESCLADSRVEVRGYPRIKGTAVAELFNFTLAPVGANVDSIDATLTLAYQGQTAVFRARISGGPFLVLSAEDVMCRVLDANPTATVVNSSGQTEEKTIFQVFGFTQPVTPSDSLKLCLFTRPRTGEVACQSIQELDFNPFSGTTDYSASMKLVIYVTQ